MADGRDLVLRKITFIEPSLFSMNGPMSLRVKCSPQWLIRLGAVMPIARRHPIMKENFVVYLYIC
jgi:hypothetical protein